MFRVFILLVSFLFCFSLVSLVFSEVLRESRREVTRKVGETRLRRGYGVAGCGITQMSQIGALWPTERNPPTPKLWRTG